MKLRRKFSVFVIITVCFLLQTTLFQTLSLASISPNLLIVVTSAFGFMRGRKEGMWTGFFCGLLLDIFFGSVITQGGASEEECRRNRDDIFHALGVEQEAA